MNPRNESDTLILPHKEVVIIINEKQAFNLNSTSENLLVQRGAKSSFDDRQKSANNLSFEKLQEAKRKVYSMYNQNLQSFVKEKTISYKNTSRNMQAPGKQSEKSPTKNQHCLSD